MTRSNAAILPPKRGMSLAMLAACLGLASCGRMDEEAMRAYVGQWFQLDDTMGFAAMRTCTSAAFRLVDTQVGSSLPVTRSARQALGLLKKASPAALDRRDQAPDAGMVDLVNLDRELGYRMRRAALEGRGCMDEVTASAFGYALVNPRAMLAFDPQEAVVMLLDPDMRVLIVAMGEG